MKTKYLFAFVMLVAGFFANDVRAQDATPPAAAATTQPGVTLINMHMKQAMPEDVFNALAKQAGIRFSTNGNLWDQDAMQAPIDVDLTDQP